MAPVAASGSCALTGRRLDDTGLIKIITGVVTGGAVIALLLWLLGKYESRKIRTAGEFDDLVKRTDAQIAKLEAEIKFWRERSDTFEAKALEVKTRLDSMRGLAREAVNELEKNGQ